MMSIRKARMMLSIRNARLQAGLTLEEVASAMDRTHGWLSGCENGVIPVSPALEAYIQKAFPDEFSFKVDDAILNGSGAGMPLGILNSGAVLSIAKEESVFV